MRRSLQRLLPQLAVHRPIHWHSCIPTVTSVAHPQRRVQSTSPASEQQHASRPTSLLSALHARGLLQACTAEEEMDELLSTRSVGVYCGFDPTAPTLHVGNLLAILGLVHAKLCGHRPVALVGGATGVIGDPSGRTQERDQQDLDVIRANADGIRATLERVFANVLGPDHQQGVTLVNNIDWYKDMNVLHFMRDIGRHFRMHSMMGRESVQTRLSSQDGMSYTEFSYQMFQAFDFKHLLKTHDCRVQLGGSDQWGNITAGCELIRRTTDSRGYGVTIPLLTTSSGEKFGKSAGNAIWLDANMTPVFDFYQFLVRVDDADVERYLKALTLMDLNNVASVMTDHQLAPEKRLAQHRLAFEVTALIHGRDEAEKAAETSRAVYSKRTFRSLSASEIELMGAEGTMVDFSQTHLHGDGIPVTRLAAMTPIFPSASEARRTIKAGGLYINDERISDTDAVVTATQLVQNKYLLLQRGRKHKVILRAIDGEAPQDDD